MLVSPGHFMKTEPILNVSTIQGRASDGKRSIAGIFRRFFGFGRRVF
jgi:hypothetical protein